MFGKKTKKTFGNTTSSGASQSVSDLKVWGNGDAFKLISKAWSEEEGWMKSTKAMEIPKVGVIVQVTTQQGDNVSEALTYVPMTKIKETLDAEGKVISRELVRV